MVAFLTVEDINSTILRFGSANSYHILDTSRIGSQEFSDVKLDFAEVNHSISGSAHTFTFEIVNSNWTGGYYFTDAEGEYLDSDASYSSNTITFTTSEETVKLVLYCTNLTNTFNFTRLTSIITNLNEVVLSVDELGTTKSWTLLDLTDGSTSTATSTINNFGINNCSNFYFMVYMKKTDFICNPNQTLTIGKINKVRLNVDAGFLPGGDYLNNSTLNMNVKYNGALIEVYYDSTLEDYCFNLDLTDKTNPGVVEFILKVSENDYIKSSNVKCLLSCTYLFVDNFSDLINSIQSDNIHMIQLAKDITVLSNIQVSNDIYIRGNNHVLDLDGHSFILGKGTVFKADNICFHNGDTTIVQKENTKLELNNCEFIDCTSENYNNLGSCIFCDVNLENLVINDDFFTNILNCTFKNNHSAIFHGGILTVNNCKFLNNNINYIDKNNPSFLYQVDGTAIIQNSIFDMDYNVNTLCTNEENIGFGQTLLKCGDTAIINGADKTTLINDRLPFFNPPYGNLSHIYAKYYYLQIEDCVCVSPEFGMEDKAVCYCVSDDDHIFKQGVQITRIDSNNQNELRKIVWDD